MQIKDPNDSLIMQLHLQILIEANNLIILEIDQMHQIQTYDPETQTIITSFIQKLNDHEQPEYGGYILS